MAKILLKRGLASNLPASLDAGEPAFTTDTGKLYVGTGASKVLINPDKVSAAAAADKLTISRTFKLDGEDMQCGSQLFDGTENVVLPATLSTTGVTAGTYPKVTVDKKGRVTAGASLTASDIPYIPFSKVTGLGTAAAANTGTAAGNVPMLNAGGKLDVGVLPAIAINDTFEVATEAAMLALTAERGDIAIRTDLSKCFVLAADAPSILASWKELKTPTDVVSSVAGKTGTVTLTKNDVGLALVDNVKQYSAANPPPYPVTAVGGAHIEPRQGVVSLSLSDVAGCELATTLNSHTAIITNDYLDQQNYLKSSSVIDCGTF